MSKKISILVTAVIVFVIVLGSLLFWQTRHATSALFEGSDPSVYAFAQLKKSCTIFAAEASDRRVYTNTHWRFSFMYPADTLVCEQTFPTENVDSSHVTLWRSTDFNGNSPAEPLLILDVDSDDATKLPPMRVLDESTVKIGGHDAILTHVQPSSCSGDNTCRTIAMIKFVYDRHTFVIQYPTTTVGVLETFTFLGAQ